MSIELDYRNRLHHVKNEVKKRLVSKILLLFHGTTIKHKTMLRQESPTFTCPVICQSFKSSDGAAS